MRSSIKGALAGLAAVAALAAASNAAAGCGDAKFRPATFQGSVSQMLHQADFEHTIVGLWSVRFLVNGNVFDFGYAQWHADGTEILNSGGRSPASENFCLGVWRQTGPNNFHLNHLALSYDPSSGQLNAKVQIKEDVTLDGRGDAYSGPFTIDIFDPTTGAPVGHVAGQVTGQRVTAN